MWKKINKKKLFNVTWRPFSQSLKERGGGVGKRRVMADETISEGLQTGGEDADTVQTAIVKRRYPYAPVFFLLAVTVGQR